MINKFKRKYYFLIIVFLAIIFLFQLLNEKNEISKKKEINKIEISQACFKNNCFNIEIADTAEKRKMGLMFREKLDENSGMLFIFDEAGIYKFWMKNTLIPLDIIWIDENNEIVYIQKKAQPCKVEQCETFGSDKKAKYVLEINGGASEETGLNVGNKALFNPHLLPDYF